MMRATVYYVGPVVEGQDRQMVIKEVVAHAVDTERDFRLMVFETRKVPEGGSIEFGPIGRPWGEA